jgi:hypothetical protein
MLESTGSQREDNSMTNESAELASTDFDRFERLSADGSIRSNECYALSEHGFERTEREVLVGRRSIEKSISHTECLNAIRERVGITGIDDTHSPSRYQHWIQTPSTPFLRPLPASQ